MITTTEATQPSGSSDAIPVKRALDDIWVEGIGTVGQTLALLHAARQVLMSVHDVLGPQHTVTPIKIDLQHRLLDLSVELFSTD